MLSRKLKNARKVPHTPSFQKVLKTCVQNGYTFKKMFYLQHFFAFCIKLKSNTKNEEED